MILILAAATTIAATPAPAPAKAEANFETCIGLVESDAAAAIAFADKWRIDEAGGVPARQCLGLAYAKQARWIPAATAFEQAAQEAEKLRDGRAGNLWVQAGNSALAAGEAARARQAFDAAIASGALKAAELGEAHLDRARALVALRDPASARKDLDEATRLVPADPLGWLLSASLARRTGDLIRAQADIEKAFERSPDDAAVALEAGNIALAAGKPDAARTAWNAAIANAPKSVEAEAARKALEQFKDAPAP